MGWSNSLPPQIQTLQDGTTVFNGPIVVDKTDGSTAASLNQDGSVNGAVANFNSINLAGNDLATTISQYSKGTKAIATLDSTNPNLSSNNTYQINNSTPCLMLLTGGFSTDGLRAYECKIESMKGFIDTAGNAYRYELVAFVDTYPTSANYVANAVHIAGGYVQATGSAGNYEFPAIGDFRVFQAHNQVWVGLLVTQVIGPGSVKFNVSNAPIFITVTDAGPAGNYSTGVYDPVGYISAAPPPPTQNFNQNFYSTWGQSYDSNGNTFYGGTADLYQGNPDAAGGFGHGVQRSAANWDYNTIASTLSGATNISGTLYFYCKHSYNNAGMNFILFSHNTRSGSAPGNVSGITGITDDQRSGGAPNPGWIAIDITAFMAAWAAGTLTGFGFFANTNDLSYYGYFAGPGDGPSPYINMSWTK